MNSVTEVGRASEQGKPTSTSRVTGRPSIFLLLAQSLFWLALGSHFSWRYGSTPRMNFFILRPMIDTRRLLGSAKNYVLQHPEELLRAGKNALFWRFGVPLDLLRWLAEQLPGQKAPKNIQIEAVPPGVRLGATLDLMGTVVRASGILYVEHVRFNAEELRLELRLADVSLKLLKDAPTPVATLIKSGALDLSKPGNLVAYMPKRPAFLVEAKDDRIVVDLMKHPTIARQNKWVGLVTPFVSVGAIRTDWEHLDVTLRPLQHGISQAISSVRERL